MVLSDDLKRAADRYIELKPKIFQALIAKSAGEGGKLKSFFFQTEQFVLF